MLVHEINNTPPGPSLVWSTALLRSLSAAWSGTEYGLTMRGAMATSVAGIGTFAAEFLRQVYQKDLRLEFWSAANGVQWAAALGASLFPVEAEGYSEYRTSELLAGLFASPGDRIPSLVDGGTHFVLDGILAVSNSAPVLEFANEFGSADISRLRAVVDNMAKWNQHPDFLQEAVDKFNAEVRQVEKRQDALRALTLDRLLPGAATTVAAILSKVDPATSFGVLVASGVLTGAARYFAPHNQAVGRLVDFMDGALVGKRSDAVLVSRVRKQLKTLKK